MAAKTDDELATLCDAEINDATSYERSTLAEERTKALDFYNGDLDIPAEDGRSSVVSSDVADTVEWIMPQLMKTFMAAESVAEYEPQSPEDEPFCKQATDYVNYVFQRENDGFLVMYSWFKDALLLKNGIVKHWWDQTPRYQTSSHYGLSDDQFLMLAQGDDVEIVEHSQEDDETAPPMLDEAGQPLPPPQLHDVKIKRKVEDGRIRVECVPPEEFLISRRARSLVDADFVGHRRKMTASDLIAQGFDPKTVKNIPSWSESQDEELSDVRWESEADDGTKSSADESMREVMVYECYIRTDRDGDGVAELMRVLIAGNPGKRSVLESDEVDDVPFSDLTPIIMPHRWQGRSIADLVVDIQRVKSVLLRQTLDNLYAANRPKREVVASQIENPDELFSSEFGGIVRVKTPGAIRDLVVPFVAQHTFPMLEYMDNVRAWRTGVSATTAALDPEALQNQTATAVNQAQSAAQAKIELIARVFAETGVRRLFRCLLKLIVQYQDRPKVIRLRNEWVQMDPRSWNAGMDAVVNVGLGNGSKERDVGVLGQILNEQKQVMGAMGPDNPVFGLQEYANTFRKLLEASGIKNPEQYVKDPTQAPPQQPQPNPEMMKLQAEQQARQAEMQAKMQLEQARMQSQAQIEQMKAQMNAEIEREKAAMQIEAEREKANLQAAVERDKLQAEYAFKERELLMEADLERLKMAAGSRDGQGNINVSE